jgi:lysophospholipase L1-like esterase
MTLKSFGRMLPLFLTLVAAAQQAPVVKPSEMVSHTDVIKLSKDKPSAWASGTPLPGLLTGNPNSGVGRVTEPGALDGSSVVVTKGDKVLVNGKDYLFDPVWGVFGIGPQSSVTTDDEVTVRYRYSTLRLDSIARTRSGKQIVKQGSGDITTPKPPALEPGETRVANIFVPYFSDGHNGDVYPLTETAAQAPTATTSGMIPKTLAKLRAGQHVQIVCWGDSITAGGDATGPATRYTHLFELALKKKYPAADIHLDVEAAGGSTSREWLYPDKWAYGSPHQLNWERVIASKPDLVTIEFANDGYIDTPQQLPADYEEILKRLHSIGAEVIFITPSFFDLELMDFKTQRDTDHRPYIAFLHKFTVDHHLAMADAAARWNHLWTEGTPYLTLLNNGYNHPDDRGHLLFVEELMKNFDDLRADHAGKAMDRP